MGARFTKLMATPNQPPPDRVFLRFHRPWEYRPIRPGFMSPWGSQDLFTESPSWFSIMWYMGVLAGITWAFDALMYRAYGKTKHKNATNNLEWFEAIQDRQAREGQEPAATIRAGKF
eukprot:TRINITY_DN17231_c0_g1_i1.p1 TRINITY_DN17231_c0_g1~~TRINITY_DN17231_c0_g1_i1.p1  ORF type:complete len:126 (+),score=20.96 TRINITY_DN17231_c0_g1_i1:29-379(+)